MALWPKMPHFDGSLLIELFVIVRRFGHEYG
jgi:hypothetical protein